MGIAVEDVPGVAASMESAFGVGAYGSGVPTFQPVGDVDGLLILVSPGRHWFPTATPSAARRLAVHIDSMTAGALEPGPGITIHSTAASNDSGCLPADAVRPPDS
ncbi:hypothetical protein [Sinomonas terrae]|uniref:Uncharacterized protein n=1 Tax=Sinomonas terrae TaxID=2908838 RepID=A0ABS9U5X1_9MICC|nr:hypothetical protein [Sinomonas terrae]MCH6472069.1 hypothetical protein [Sinomonas terrae]